MLRKALLSILVFVVTAACGSDGSSPSSDGGGSGGGGGTGATGGAPADGPFACGATTCAASQFCIHPCCGGAPPLCQPKPEGGACPTGFHDGCQLGGCSDPSGCCEMDPCTPAPAYCADQPESGCMLQGHDCHMTCA